MERYPDEHTLLLQMDLRMGHLIECLDFETVQNFV